MLPIEPLGFVGPMPRGAVQSDVAGTNGSGYGIQIYNGFAGPYYSWGPASIYATIGQAIQLQILVSNGNITQVDYHLQSALDGSSTAYSVSVGGYTRLTPPGGFGDVSKTLSPPTNGTRFDYFTDEVFGQKNITADITVKGFDGSTGTFKATWYITVEQPARNFTVNAMGPILMNYYVSGSNGQVTSSPTPELGLAEIPSEDQENWQNYILIYSGSVNNTTHYVGAFGYVQTVDPYRAVGYTKPAENWTFNPNGPSHGTANASQYLDTSYNASDFWYQSRAYFVNPSTSPTPVNIPPDSDPPIWDAPAAFGTFVLNDGVSWLTLLSGDDRYQTHLVFQNADTSSTGGIPISISTANWTWKATATSPIGDTNINDWTATISPLGPASYPGDGQNSLMQWWAPFGNDSSFIMLNNRMNGQA